MFSIKFPLVYGKIIRENSLRYKNVTATYHRYQGIVPYLFCSVGAGTPYKLKHEVGSEK
jgi:hypothetical protein